MPREYRHIKQHENKLLDLRSQGLTYNEIADKIGFSKMQVKRFFERYRINQRKINAGQAIHKKGRPCKNGKDGLPPSIQKLDKLAQMRYIMSSKDRYIKRLEMENELMRDFLSLTERK